jgi:hypothetical protein
MSDKRKVELYAAGDTLMGVPFFRSWNEGAQIGARLASVLSKSDPALRHRKNKQFQRYFFWRSTWCVLRARIYNLFIKVFKGFFALSRNSDKRSSFSSKSLMRRVMPSIIAENVPPKGLPLSVSVTKGEINYIVIITEGADDSF